ncbi:sugar transporter ERD6-like 15 isoform X4 [Gossypium australe]|uniref:Sugar transporter ERD6-like 15 isoform X4 n=1 Tax=Gossypium australe TaxID=47621 RepID=A0A5B6VTX7_9ROSI|nr:sugar transporter ERD6-like 15 isoform X4 [Gossypium australe]
MEQQRKEATERLLSRQGHHNLVPNEENGGAGVCDEGLVAVSNFTSILGLSTITAACITFGFGCAIGYSSPTQSSIMEDLGLSVAEFSLFGSILSIGSLIGAAISGKITDLFGRKLAPWLLNLGRLSLGFTNGISNYLASIYVAEITTKNVRGRFTIIVQFLTGWGVSFMFVVGSFVHWRTLALLATIPALLQLLLLFFIPESPQWLMSTIRVSLKFYSYGSVPILKAQAKFGREKELEAALLCLRGDKADISHEATEIKDYVESLKSFSSEGILDIFQKKYVRPLLTVAGALVLMNLGGINALTYYSGAIFVSAGVSSMVGLITLAATQTVIGILGATLIDKLGRRPLLLVSSAGLRFSSFLTGVSFFLMDSDISPSSLHVARFVSSPSCMLTSKDFNWWDQGSPILAFIGLLASYPFSPSILFFSPSPLAILNIG